MLGDALRLVEIDEDAVEGVRDEGRSETADLRYGVTGLLPAPTVLPEAVTTSVSLRLLIFPPVCFLFGASSLLFSKDSKVLPGLVRVGQVIGFRNAAA